MYIVGTVARMKYSEGVRGRGCQCGNKCEAVKLKNYELQSERSIVIGGGDDEANSTRRARCGARE